MTDLIFGGDWQEIQDIQQKRHNPERVNMNTPPGPTPPTDRDRELLAEHGMDGLRALGLDGVVDRLNQGKTL